MAFLAQLATLLTASGAEGRWMPRFCTLSGRAAAGADRGWLRLDFAGFLWVDADKLLGLESS